MPQVRSLDMGVSRVVTRPPVDIPVAQLRVENRQRVGAKRGKVRR
jgi:hypothetical protein